MNETLSCNLVWQMNRHSSRHDMISSVHSHVTLSELNSAEESVKQSLEESSEIPHVEEPRCSAGFGSGRGSGWGRPQILLCYFGRVLQLVVVVAEGRAIIFPGGRMRNESFSEFRIKMWENKLSYYQATNFLSCSFMEWMYVNRSHSSRTAEDACYSINKVSLIWNTVECQWQ